MNTVKISLPDLVSLVQGRLLSGSPDILIGGFASLKDAVAGDLCFLGDRRYQAQVTTTKASAVLVPENWTESSPDIAFIGVANPSRSFEKVVEIYGMQPEALVPGVHPTAVVAVSAVFDPEKVRIGANAVIEEGACLGDGADIGAGCYLGKDVRVGADTKLYANVTVHAACLLGERVTLHSGVVIGADGFGYEFEQGRHRKIRQSGHVQIDNDVEIGAGTMVDRARFGRTWIGAGTKIDNLVQIGHNVVIGRHCIIVACVAIAGSATIGDYVVIAAQAGVAGHVVVGSQATLGGRCGVTKDLEGGQMYLGFPAIPVREEKRRLASINRIPKLVTRIEELEARLKVLTSEQDAPGV